MYASLTAVPRRLPAGTVLLWLVALIAVPTGAAVPELLTSLWQGAPPLHADYEEIVLYYSHAPRLAMAILIGCGLGLAGAVLQQVLRNPLASPTTLGVEAGAQFAIAVTTLHLPALLAFSPDLVAILGALTAAGMVVALTWKLGFSPVTVILAGLVISFFLGALNAAFLLFNGEYLSNIFIWGAGSLLQNDWSQFAELWPRVALIGLAMVLLARPLQLLQLGETSARAMGARVGALRLLALFLVVLMTATVVARVGVLAFVSLAAPVLARLLGARTLLQRLLWSTLLGGGLLLASDVLAQWATQWYDGNLVPTGTTTAIIGGPVILLALRGLRNDRHMPGEESAPARFAPRRGALLPVVMALAAVLVVVTVLALSLAPGITGWQWSSPGQWGETWHWRGPRLMAAMMAGVALGLAGTIVQRLTGNVMASPEVLGISGGAALAMVVTTLLGFNPGRTAQMLLGALGAGGVLLLVMVMARRHRFSGHQLLLGGVAIYVFMDAALRLVLASGGSEAVRLLNWMSGSTWLVTAADAWLLTGLVAVLATAVTTTVRVLTLLPLGDSTATAAGLDVPKARFGLLALAALLTASATVVIGPLSFVGLMAPHLARVLGQQTVGRQLLVAALVGAALLGVADYLSRVVIYPNQLPAGLLAAIVGGLYFLWGLSRHGRH